MERTEMKCIFSFHILTKTKIQKIFISIMQIEKGTNGFKVKTRRGPEIYYVSESLTTFLYTVLDYIICDPSFIFQIPRNAIFLSPGPKRILSIRFFFKGLQVRNIDHLYFIKKEKLREYSGGGLESNLF